MEVKKSELVDLPKWVTYIKINWIHTKKEKKKDVSNKTSDLAFDF